MDDKKTLRVLAIISSVFSLYKILSFVYKYFSVEADLTNPLIPRYIIDFVRFPIYILLPVFIGIFIYMYNVIRRKNYKPIVQAVFIALVGYSIFESYIYQFINSFNPYGV